MVLSWVDSSTGSFELDVEEAVGMGWEVEVEVAELSEALDVIMMANISSQKAPMTTADVAIAVD